MNLLVKQAFGTKLRKTEPITWTAITTGYTTGLYSVAYGNGNWVAVDNSGHVLVATDPTGTWTQYNTPLTGAQLRTVAYGNGNWVIADGTTICYASDPTGTWTSKTVATNYTTVRRIKYFNGYWMLVGDTANYAYASDPTGTWTNVGLPNGGPSYGIAYNNSIDLWVNPDRSDYIDYSSTPPSSLSYNATGLGYQLLGLDYGDGFYAGAGISGALQTATDATSTWTSRTSGFGSDHIYDIAFGNNAWVTVGGNGKLFTVFVDPTKAWTSRTSNFGSDAIFGVYYGNNYWVAVGGSGKISVAQPGI